MSREVFSHVQISDDGRRFLESTEILVDAKIDAVDAAKAGENVSFLVNLLKELSGDAKGFVQMLYGDSVDFEDLSEVLKEEGVNAIVVSKEFEDVEMFPGFKGTVVRVGKTLDGKEAWMFIDALGYEGDIRVAISVSDIGGEERVLVSENLDWIK